MGPRELPARHLARSPMTTGERSPSMIGRRVATGVAAVASAVVGLLAAPEAVGAHALGTVFRLPIPLWMYLAGAGIAVGASFIVSAVVVKVGSEAPRYPRLAIPDLPSRILSWLLAAIGLVWW